MSVAKRYLHDLVAWALPFAMLPLWIFPYFRHLLTPEKADRKVLLVARNAIAADHLIEIRRLFNGNEHIDVFVTSDRLPARDFDRFDAEAMIGAESLHILSALVVDWDLIIFTNHPYGLGVCFPTWIAKLYVNHGLHSGKINNSHSEDGVYGRCKVIRPFGKPYYDCMFAANEWEKALAVSETRELEGHVEVTGFLRADVFLDYVGQQAGSLRAKLGVKSDATVVHIISTWGSNSLFAVYGEKILEQVELLRKKYTFVVSIHPRFDDLSAGEFEPRDSILSRFEEVGAIVNRDLDWSRYVAISDVAISDHSSLAFYHLLAENPLLLADVPSDQYIEGSTFDLLSKNCPRLSQYEDMGEAISSVANRVDNGEDLAWTDRLLDYSGFAEQRYREEIGKMLGIPFMR